MDEDRLHQSDDDFAAVDDTVMSSTSPYQPTTEPVPHRRSFVGGWILEMHFVKSIAGAVLFAKSTYLAVINVYFWEFKTECLLIAALCEKMPNY